MVILPPDLGKPLLKLMSASPNRAEMWTRLTAEQVSADSQSISSPGKSTASVRRTDIWLPPCLTELQAAFLDAAMGRVKCQRLSKGYVHQSSMASHAMLPGGDTHSSVASALLHSQIYCH